MATYSMEEFAELTNRNISAADLTHRRVVAVGTLEVLGLDAEDAEKNAVWVIQFEDGSRILNYDPTIPAPTHIVGAELNMTILGSHSAERQPVTELRFGLNAVKLNPMEYAMQSPDVTDNHIVFAQRSRYNA